MLVPRIQEPVQRPLAPPARTDIRRNVRTLGKRNTPNPTPRSKDSESLFVSQGDDDEQTWDPPDYGNTEETLGWDVSDTGVR
jgi:hypothetical protein